MSDINEQAKIFAVWASDGLSAGFYRSDMHAVIPADAVEINEAQWSEFIENQGLRRWDGTAVVAYEAPAPGPETIAFLPISDRQFFQALASEPYSIITTQEALDAVKTGEIPAVMQAVIDGLPQEHQFATTMLLAGATTFERDNPLVDVFGASQGMDAAAIDAFWLAAAAL